MKSLTSKKPETASPTRGYNVGTLKTGNFEFNIWDIGGQKAIRAYWQNFYDKNNAIVWVIDSSDENRLIETGQELASLLQEEKLAGLPLLILANKQDLSSALPPDDVFCLLTPDSNKFKSNSNT